MAVVAGERVERGGRGSIERKVCVLCVCVCCVCCVCHVCVCVVCVSCVCCVCVLCLLFVLGVVCVCVCVCACVCVTRGVRACDVVLRVLGVFGLPGRLHSMRQREAHVCMGCVGRHTTRALVQLNVASWCHCRCKGETRQRPHSGGRWRAHPLRTRRKHHKGRLTGGRHVAR